MIVMFVFNSANGVDKTPTDERKSTTKIITRRHTGKGETHLKDNVIIFERGKMSYYSNVFDLNNN